MSTQILTPGKCTAIAVLGGVGLAAVSSVVAGAAGATASTVAMGGVLSWLGGVAGNQVQSWFGSKLKNPPPKADEVFHNHHIRQLLSQAIISTVEKLVPLAQEKLGGVSQILIDSGKTLAKRLDIIIDSPSGSLAEVREFNVTAILTAYATNKGRIELLGVEDWKQLIDEEPTLKDLKAEERDMLISALHYHFAEALWNLVKHDAATDRQAFAAVELLYLSQILETVQTSEVSSDPPDLSPIITRISALLNEIDQKHTEYFQSILGGITALRGKFDDFFTTYRKDRTQDDDFQAKTTASLAALTSPTSHFELLKQRYLRRLIEAFSTYEDLETSAISTADGKERITRIGDIFVPPACSTARCEADTFDRLHAAGKHPTTALLPLLALEENRRTVLLADPGYGKSTLLQWLIVTLAEGKSPEHAAALRGCIPLPLIVRDVVRHLPDDVKAWTSWDELLKAFRQVRPPLSKSQPPLLGDFEGSAYAAEFSSLIKDSKAYFIVDGLDEIGDPEKRKAFRDAIWAGMRANPEARWLITSRVIGYELAQVDVDEFNLDHAHDVPAWEHDTVDDFYLRSRWGHLAPLDLTFRAHVLKDRLLRTYYIKTATRLFLAPFDDLRQQNYAQKWFEHRTGIKNDDRAVKLIEEAHRHAGVRVISRVPSILCLMAILKRKGLPLPDGRAELFDKITEAYLKTIDEKRNIPRPFTDEQAKRWLSIIAIHMQKHRDVLDPREEETRPTYTDEEPHKGEILAGRSAIEGWLLPILTPECPDETAARKMLQNFLSYVANRSALLQPRGEGVYGFVHLSFLEYFAACYLERELRHHYDLTLDRLSAESEGSMFDETDYLRRNPRGPIVIYPKELPPWTTRDVWHEALVFLMEFHSSSAEHPTRDRLLKSLFPTLHGPMKTVLARPKNEKKPTVSDALLPLPAVTLVMKLAGDRQLALPIETRENWWRRLWSAYLTWPHLPNHHADHKRWNIAPILLSFSALQTEIMAALVGETKRLGITTLRLYRCSEVSDLAKLKDLINLKSLSLISCTGVTDLAALKDMHNLQWLSLHGCTGVNDLAALKDLYSLQSLNLSGCTEVNDLAALKDLRNLQRLFLNGCTKVTDLVALKDLHSLQTLSFSGCTGVRDIAVLKDLRSLQSLNLSGCTGVSNLAALKDLYGMQSLNLNGCTGVKELVALKGLHSLQTLSVSGCTGVCDLTALRDLRSLQSLNLRARIGVNNLNPQVADLKLALPNCRIHF